MTPLKNDSLGHFSTLKNDSPVHFSMSKADTGSNFNIKFWTKSREKVTPSWNFDFKGGNFSMISPHWKISLYIPANKVVEVYWFHHGCLSVCLSVCEKVVLYHNFYRSSIWHYDDTLHICWSWPDEDLCWFCVKMSNLDFKNFFNVSAQQLHFLLAYNTDTSQIYWPWPENDLYWFWGQRIEGQGHI